MLDGMVKEEPPTVKKLPVEANVPKFLAKAGQNHHATELMAAVGYLSLIAFYYLLHVGEYTGKGFRVASQQTEPFKLGDVTFFTKNKCGQLRQLPRGATDREIMRVHSATLKLDNQKNGWKNVCIHQEETGDPYLCPVRALGR